MQPGDDGEDDEPEPEEDVDLLVDDVHAQHAEGVETLDRAGASVLVEDALCHLMDQKNISLLALVTGSRYWLSLLVIVIRGFKLINLGSTRKKS